MSVLISLPFVPSPPHFVVLFVFLVLFLLPLIFSSVCSSLPFNHLFFPSWSILIRFSNYIQGDIHTDLFRSSQVSKSSIGTFPPQTLLSTFMWNPVIAIHSTYRKQKEAKFKLPIKLLARWIRETKDKEGKTLLASSLQGLVGLWRPASQSVFERVRQAGLVASR